jgi:Glycosyl transferases group 1
MRILLMAPFERGRQHGGSQRATAMAERLEERGAEVAWQVFPGATTSTLEKLRGDLQLKPAMLGIYPEGEPAHAGKFDAVVSSHSYLAWHLARFPADVIRVIDFHNLEWRTLANAARSVRGLRALHPWLQVALMRRYERRAIAGSDLSTFVSPEELAWAQSSAADGQVLLVPSVLPRAAEQQALTVGELREGRREQGLAYVGSLDFHPNVRALVRFLRNTWPAVRAAVPGLHLTIAGKCSESDRRLLESFPGTQALGFVDDVVPILSQSAAVILPVDGWGGTSLRALYYAVARIPVIGPPAAFRGLPWKSGTVAESAQEWADAVKRVVVDPPGGEIRVEPARGAALGLQRDSGPWDRLMTKLVELKSKQG